MWAIIKFKKNNLQTLKKELSNKLDNDLRIYVPKLKIQKFIKNKIFDKEIPLLGNYLFCFHPYFKKQVTFSTLKYCRGLEYFLLNYLKNQKQIVDFINHCKNSEDKNGFIKQSFFEYKNITDFEFLSGPFINMIFKIINEEKSKINILVNKMKITVPKEKYLFRPV